jgi:hypothetical protein
VTARPGRALGWLAGLVVAAIALRLAAHGTLSAPSLGSPGALTDWAGGREPVVASVALVRLVAEVATWYLLALSALHLVSGALRTTGGHRLADALSLPAARRLVRAGLGVALVAAPVGDRDEVASPGVATMAPVAHAPLATEAGAEAPRGTATMQPVATATTDRGTAPMVPAPATWTVTAGDSLWSIAEELLADAWHRPPTDAEVDPFWRTLVAANQARLVDPSDPDLIHPGQVFEVPPLPPPLR